MKLYCISLVSYTVEPPIKDPLRKGQPPYKGHSSRSLYHSTNTFLTSEKRTTSKIRTEAVPPKCPSFGGSTVFCGIPQTAFTRRGTCMECGHYALKPQATFSCYIDPTYLLCSSFMSSQKYLCLVPWWWSSEMLLQYRSQIPHLYTTIIGKWSSGNYAMHLQSSCKSLTRRIKRMWIMPLEFLSLASHHQREFT